MENFKHIIWDFDGTLFNTYPHMARAFQIMLKRIYSVTENILEIENNMRISMKHAYKYYEEKYEIDDDFIDSFNQFRELYENQHAHPYNNVQMICKFVFEQGMKNYLFTHRDKTALSLLKKFGLLEMFTECVTIENGFERKPSTQGLEYLINKYKINPAEALCIGDREVDLICAKHAGIKSCFYTENINRTLPADFTVQNFSDLYYILNSSLTTKKDG